MFACEQNRRLTLTFRCLLLCWGARSRGPCIRYVCTQLLKFRTHELDLLQNVMRDCGLAARGCRAMPLAEFLVVGLGLFCCFCFVGLGLFCSFCLPCGRCCCARGRLDECCCSALRHLERRGAGVFLLLHLRCRSVGPVSNGPRPSYKADSLVRHGLRP